MSKLDRIHTFIKIIEHNGFNAAATVLGLSAAAVSRQVSALEKELGTQLLRRNTRQLWLTDMGKLYLEECKKTLSHLNDVELSISANQREPAGHLKVMATRYFAENYLLPYLPEFYKQFPKVTLHLELAERFPDFMQENIDILFGVSMDGPPDLVRRRVMTTRYVLCASPAYLKKFGTPKTPKELDHHFYITHSMRKPADVIWLKNLTLHVSPFLWLNDVRAMQTSALNGLGIVMLHSYAIAKDLKEKKLIEILPSYAKPPLSVYLYYFKNRFMQSKIRCFIDFYMEKIN